MNLSLRDNQCSSVIHKSLNLRRIQCDTTLLSSSPHSREQVLLAEFRQQRTESKYYHHHEFLLWQENRYGQEMLDRLCATTAQHRRDLEDEARWFQQYVQNNAEQ
eukprot:2831653-Amphidinium_carterae.1